MQVHRKARYGSINFSVTPASSFPSPNQPRVCTSCKKSILLDEMINMGYGKRPTALAPINYDKRTIRQRFVDFLRGEKYVVIVPPPPEPEPDWLMFPQIP
jgi:hypothetical protein